MISSEVRADPASRKPPRRRLNGVLLLDKPLGISSQAAVTRVKSLLQALKAGHTGTLDPMATGLLPICLGDATKFSQMLLDSDKTYAATVRLGIITSTGDMEGEIIKRAAVHATRSDVERVLPHFRGDIMQTPPMFSALKHQGRPLYAYARAGEELPRQPRPVSVFSLEMASFENEEIELIVRCSKGTYIRSLAEDIGRELGCGACLSALRRTSVGEFEMAQGGVTIDELQRLTLSQRDSLLLPVDALVSRLPRLDLNQDQMRRILRGQGIAWHEALAAGLARAYGPGQEFIGVVEFQAPGTIMARRLMAHGTAIQEPLP